MSLSSNEYGTTHFRQKLEKRQAEREKFQKKPNEYIVDNHVKMQDSNNLMSRVQKYNIEKYLVEVLSDPLVDLPINSNEILIKARKYFIKRSLNISEEFFNKLLVKFSTTYKLIK